MTGHWCCDVCGRSESVWLCLAANGEQEAALYWFSVSPQSRMKTLIKELSGLGTGASLRFGDITEQHESLECVLNLCSRRHTHLRGHPALVHFQLAFWRHVAAKWWSGCSRGQESWAGETERAAFPGQRGGRVFTPVQTSSTVKMRSSGWTGYCRPPCWLWILLITLACSSKLFTNGWPQDVSQIMLQWHLSQTDKSLGFIALIQLVIHPHKVFWKGEATFNR